MVGKSNICQESDLVSELDGVVVDSEGSSCADGSECEGRGGEQVVNKG